MRTEGCEVGIIFRDGRVLGRSSITAKEASKCAEDRRCRGKETSEGRVVHELAKHAQWGGPKFDGPSQC